jgi:hypothetical protein
MKKIPHIIASLKLACIITLIASVFVGIWGDGSLALKIVVTAIASLVIIWFSQQVFKNVIESILKEKQGPIPIRKSRFQQRIEAIQLDKRKESNKTISDTLDEMLNDANKK